MQKKSAWKRMSKFLAVLLCISMLLPYAFPGARGTETETETPSDTTETAWWPMLDTMSFDDGEIAPLTAKLGTPAAVLDGDDYVLELPIGARAQYSNNALTQTAGYYKISGWFKKANDATSVTVTYWYRLATGANSTGSFNVQDCVTATDADGWSYFEYSFEQLGQTTLAQFVLNNHNDKTGIVWFDDVQYWRADDATDELVYAWQDQLAAWDASSMMLSALTDDPHTELTPVGDELLTNGDFSAETNVVLKDVDVLTKATGWTPAATSNYDSHIEITAAGTLLTSFPEGYGGDYTRIITTVTQSGIMIEPGAVYQMKFDYKIAASANESASWYGPYVRLETSGGDYLVVRASDAEDGLNTGGDWETFVYTFVMPYGGKGLTFKMNTWLYEQDSCEVDNIRLYKVGEAASAVLSTNDKFYYLDDGAATFTASLHDDAKANAAVNFKVFDGQTAIWTSETQTFADDAATAQFDFSGYTLQTDGRPYVVQLLLDGVAVASEEIFFTARPTTLDENGNYIKTLPNGDVPNITIAYAIDRNDDYAKVEEIGANVMSLGNIRSVDQVLDMLDYCEKYNYLGFLNMNWGLYNDNDHAKTRVLIEVVSSEEVRNHPALLGYCLTDEPWSWGAEAAVAENLAEGYRLIRQYDQTNVIFSVNNMEDYHELTTCYSDVLLIDHYEAPAGGAIYKKVKTAIDAADGKMPVWTVVGAYEEREYFPTADQGRNEVWQAFLAGTDGVGYYSISYAAYNEYGNGVAMWDYKDAEGNPVGQQLWDALASFKDKEWEIAFDRFANGEGILCSESADPAKGYMYCAWQADDGSYYVVVLNVTEDQTDVTVTVPLQIPQVDDEGNITYKTMDHYTAAVVNGSDQEDITGEREMAVTLAADQAVLYQIAPAARTVYVDSSANGGSDANEGTFDSPLLTIHAAYAKLKELGATNNTGNASDNIIVVKSLLGAESLPVNASNNRVSFSDGNTTTTIVLTTIPVTITGWTGAEDPGLTFSAATNYYSYSDLVFDNLTLEIAAGANLYKKGAFIVNENVAKTGSANIKVYYQGTGTNVVLNGGTWNEVITSNAAGTVNVSVGGTANITTLALFGGATLGTDADGVRNVNGTLNVTGGTIGNLYPVWAKSGNKIIAGELIVNISGGKVSYLYPAGYMASTGSGSIDIAKSVVNYTGGNVSFVYFGQSTTETVQNVTEMVISRPKSDTLTSLDLRTPCVDKLTLDLADMDLTFTQEQLTAIGEASAAIYNADTTQGQNKFSNLTAVKQDTPSEGCDAEYAVTLVSKATSESIAGTVTVTVPARSCGSVMSVVVNDAAEPVTAEVIDSAASFTADFGTYKLNNSYSHTEGEEVRENEVAADCANAGSYETVVYCSVCSLELSRETVTVDATGEHSYCEGVCTVCGAEKAAGKFDILGARVNLGEDLDMKFFVDPDDLTEGETYTAKMVRTYADGSTDTQTETVSKLYSDGNYYVTYSGLAAKEMGDEIQVTVYDSEGNAVSETWTDSIAKLAYRAINNTATGDVERAAFVALLNYGAAAQNTFAYDTQNLVNASLTPEQQTVAGYEGVNASEGGAKAELRLNGSIMLKSFFDANVLDNATSVTVSFTNYKNTAVEYTVSTFGQDSDSATTGLKYVPVTGLVLADAETLVTITVVSAEGTTTVKDSMASFVVRAKAAGDTDPLYDSIMAVGASVKTYLLNK